MENMREIQTALFNRIRELLPPSSSLVHEVSDVLCITPDSAYRRIRGEKPLVMDELFLLSRRFHISVDEIFMSGTRGDSFLCSIVEAGSVGFDNYLDILTENLQRIRMMPNPEIIYFAKDIPVFHHFHFPALAAFKIFFWSKTLLQLPELKNSVYDAEAVSQHTLDKGKKLLSLYNLVPSCEIWNQETAESFLRQIEYYLDSGIIRNKETAIALCDDYSAMTDHIGKQAEAAAKSMLGEAAPLPGNFKLYHNEVILGDNSIFVTSDTQKITFLTLNVLNLMISSDENFCLKMENYLRTMMKKSALISSDSEKERMRFINLIHKKISLTKERISRY